ncbi:MAG: chemotaxis protein CheR [Proteobacteria bacterium]|nr:chemotaxis protein CheR [Pseudomonadota bacterium]
MALIPWRRHRIQDVEVELVLQAMKERWGYDFTGYARASLKRRLEQIVTYFDTDCLSRLLPSILYDERVAQTVINAVSVPTSEFFRDPPVWESVRTVVLPYLGSFPRVNVWQVGCGRGQETYSLAILLQEADLLKKTRIIATDINAEFLAEARQARWPARDFDHWRENYRLTGGTGHFDDYFSRVNGEVTVREEMRRAIQFVQHNLVTDDAFLETQFIVCRSVLIYFGSALQERVFGIFLRSLERGGYLLLGCAEGLPEGPAAGELEIVQERFRLYRKMTRGDHV